MRLLYPASLVEGATHRQVVHAGAALEAIDPKRREDVVSRSPEGQDTQTAAAVLVGESQVEHWGVIGEVLQADESDPSKFLVNQPEGLVLVVGEGARFDASPGLVHAGCAPHVEGEGIAGEEADQAIVLLGKSQRHQ